MTDRIPCVVPYCRRTASAFKFEGCTEIICGKHWRMASATARRRHSKLARAYPRRFGENGFWEYPSGSADRLAAVKLARIETKAWARCKKQAIEAAAGIS